MQSRKLIKEVLAAFVAYLYFFAFFAFFVGADAWSFLWMIVPFYILMVVRKMVTNFYMFLGLHIALVGFFAFAYWGSDFILPIVGLMVLFVIYSIGRRIGNEWGLDAKAAIGLVILLGAFVILSNIFDPTDVEYLINLYIMMAIAGFCAVVAYVQINNMDMQLSLLKGEGKFASRKLFTANYIAMGGFLVVIVTFGIIAILIPTGGIANAFGFISTNIVAWIFYPFSIIFSFFQNLLDQPTPEPELPSDVNASEDININPDFTVPEADMSEVADILNTTADTIAIAWMIILIVSIVISIIILYRVMKKRYAKATKKTIDGLEIEKLEMDFGGGLRSLFGRSARLKDPTRRAYRKKVNSHIKKGVNVKLHYNTKNIADVISKEEDIDELTTQYEAARYGRP